MDELANGGRFSSEITRSAATRPRASSRETRSTSRGWKWSRMRRRATSTDRRSVGFATQDLLVQHPGGRSGLGGEVLGEKLFRVAVQLDCLAAASGPGKVEHQSLVGILPVGVNFQHLLHEAHAVGKLAAIGTNGGDAEHGRNPHLTKLLAAVAGPVVVQIIVQIVFGVK